jgi:anti-sigma factor RsiW
MKPATPTGIPSPEDPMRCKDVVDQLSDYARGDLEPAEHALVSAHLTDCADCRSMDSGLRAVPALVRAGIDDVVATVDARVRSALRRSLTPEEEQALHPVVELLKKG